MALPKLSILVWAHDTNIHYYRDMLESIVANTYEDWELLILDESNNENIKLITAEFFPGDKRVFYRGLKNQKGGAYALNIGVHFALGDAYVILGQHDRVSPGFLEEIARIYDWDEGFGIVYSDNDEIVGVDRMNPTFKPDLNKEYLFRKNYIGDAYVFSKETAQEVGQFNEQLEYAFAYDFLLRAVDKNQSFYHISNLSYHKRKEEKTRDKKIAKRIRARRNNEFTKSVMAHFARKELEANVVMSSHDRYMKITLPDGEYNKSKKRYMILKDENCKVYTRNAAEKMYSLLQQDDVAVVGCGFLKGTFTIDNLGYIFDTDGAVYPAFYDNRVFGEFFGDFNSIPRDVSMVDSAFCMIDMKVYKAIGGFDPKLTGRDVMLEYCQRVISKGYRVVLEPNVLARVIDRKIESSQESNEYLMEKAGEVILQGDPQYNANLPMGLKNYCMPDEITEEAGQIVRESNLDNLGQ